MQLWGGHNQFEQSGSRSTPHKTSDIQVPNRKPVETQLGVLEGYLLRKKFWYSSLDFKKTWTAAWRVPIQLEETKKEKGERSAAWA